MRQFFSFESVELECGRAHNGSEPIFFRRVAERSRDYVFNFLDFVIVPAGADIGLHRHAPDNQEVYVIVEGEGIMMVDDETRAVGPGDVIVNGIGGEHGLVNNSGRDLRMIVIELPAVPG